MNQARTNLALLAVIFLVSVALALSLVYYGYSQSQKQAEATPTFPSVARPQGNVRQPELSAVVTITPFGTPTVEPVSTLRQTSGKHVTSTAPATMANQTLLPTLVPIEPNLITHGNRSQPMVALTFDACQRADDLAGYDAAIIKTLTETQTSATIFLGGLWMQSHPTETRLLASIPLFELGNHSWSHQDFAVISKEEMVQEITKTQEIMYSLTEQRPTLFRLPFGTYTDEALQVIAQQGLKTIQWDLVTGDPDPNISAEAIIREVTDKAKNGSIVIMHVNGRGWHTAEALPRVIENLRAKGFKLVTVSRLLHDGD